MIGLGDQVASGLIQNAIKSILADDMTKEHDAAAAARKAFLAGEGALPGIAGVVLGGAMAASTFAAVMAFETGGIVPGVTKGDTVPAMLTPGEAVLPKRLTDNLMHSNRGAGSGGAPIHIHHSPTFHVQTIDGDGVKDMLRKHNAEFTKHFHSEVRKLNH